MEDCRPRLTKVLSDALKCNEISDEDINNTLRVLKFINVRMNVSTLMSEILSKLK